MKRKDFIQIIKLRSIWRIDKRIGDYKLPNGEKLSKYVEKLVESQMKVDSLGIADDGNLASCIGGEWNAGKETFDDYTLMPVFSDNQTCTYDDMESRVKALVLEIVN